MRRTGVLLALALLPAAARAQERDYCPDRPGIGTPACTMAPGRFSFEVGLGNWTLDRTSEAREDVFLTGDALLRYGIADHAEVQAAWTGLGLARTRERSTGAVTHRSGTGDITLALRRNLAHPDGSGLALAVMPYVSLPVGGATIGAGDWGAGLMVPLSYELSNRVMLATTTEFDAAVDEDRHGRHFAFAEVVGAELALSERLSATAEYQVTVDRDPHGHSVAHLSGLSLGWQPSDSLQLDLGANAGLDHNAPDAEVYLGVSRRF
jgi:hypothetical protein